MLNSKTKSAAVLLSGALALGTYAGGISSAGAADPSGDVGTKATETYKNEAFGDCLWGLGDSVTLGTCGVANEELEWDVTHWGDGTVRLKNVGTGKCLSDKDRTLQSDDCDESQEQSFYVDHWNDGTFRFRNQRTGECVDVLGAGTPVTGVCDTSESQSWY